MKDYSKIRKELQAIGEVPHWYTTGGMQLFDQKYAYKGETVRSRFRSIAKAMAKHAPKEFPPVWQECDYTKDKSYEEAFFRAMWDGYISCSTPLLANGGLRKRGTTVSCAGSFMGNNLFDRYNVITEAAVLTKHSHGTSVCIDDWPYEGAPLKRGGVSAGIIPVIRDLVTAMDEVVQGSRRGSLAYSLRPQHRDFEKVLLNLYNNPESNNVGWLIDDEFSQAVLHGDPIACSKLGKMLQRKMPRGKGYFTFIDKMNRHRAEAFKRLGITVKASNLCQETCLIANEKYTFSCVILNYNLELYDSWPKSLLWIGQIMSDCNISEYLETIDEMSLQDQEAMKKIRLFTEHFRALGSGVLGFHTLLQKKRFVVGSLDSLWLNDEIFSRMGKESLEVSEWLAAVMEEPEGCKGLGIRNAARLMMPPTKSTAELAAGASEGIGLDMAMAFTKQSAGGEFFRINKVLLEIMKERGVYNEEEVRKLAESKGTVQHVSWLDDHEKAVFRTAFEIPMEAHLELCSQRQKYIDQAQSINLYFSGHDTEEYISKIHRMAFEDEGILSLYYIYSMRNGGHITRSTDCESCQ